MRTITQSATPAQYISQTTYISQHNSKFGETHFFVFRDKEHAEFAAMPEVFPVVAIFTVKKKSVLKAMPLGDVVLQFSCKKKGLLSKIKSIFKKQN